MKKILLPLFASAMTLVFGMGNAFSNKAKCQANCKVRRLHQDKYVCQKNAAGAARNASSGCNADCRKGTRSTRAASLNRACQSAYSQCLRTAISHCNNLCRRLGRTPAIRMKCQQSCLISPYKVMARRCQVKRNGCHKRAQASCLSACGRYANGKGRQELTRCHYRIDREMRSCINKCR